MTPGEYDMTIFRGKTWSRTFTATVGGSAVDFETDYDGARMQVRPAILNEPEDTVEDPLIEFTTEDGQIVLDGTSLILTIPAAVSAAMDFRTGVYDLELYSGTDDAEVVDGLLYGKFEVKGEATV